MSLVIAAEQTVQLADSIAYRGLVYVRVDLVGRRRLRVAEDHLSILRRNAKRLEQRRRGMPQRVYLDPADAIVITDTIKRSSANVIVVRDDGDILLIRRTDNGNYALPGGALDVGESIAATAVRETEEETGIRCEITGLVGIYTNPHHVIEYTSNGEVRQEFSIVFTARPVSGTPRASSESSEVIWVPAPEVAQLTMHPTMRQRIGHYLEQRPSPYIG